MFIVNKNIWNPLKIAGKQYILLIIALIQFINSENIDNLLRRFEYKLSFKGPNLVLQEGNIPFWDNIGNSIPNEEFVRLAPSIKSKQGSVWSKEQNSHENWEVEITYRVTGRGRIGADGLAFWYTTDRATGGPVFGSKDLWNGLGLFFDSFDNDEQQNNPYIMAMLNNGTILYEHQSDGHAQQLGGCMRDFRNKPFPIKTKIEYNQKVLSVFFHNGLTNNNEFELCLRVENVELPKNAYFGLSAATGSLADDHDVYAFLTHSLQKRTDTQLDQEVPEADHKKYEHEYEGYKEKMEKAKDDYKKEHKIEKGKEVDEESVFEDIEIRELKNIYEGQNQISLSIKIILQKLDEVVGRQERQLSLLSLINQQKSPGSQDPTTLKKQDLEAVINLEKHLSSEVSDLKTLINDVSNKVANNKVNDDDKKFKELLLYFNSFQSEMRGHMSKLGDCSTQSSGCVSSSFLIILLVVHFVALIGYLIYKSNKDLAIKKFY